MLPHQIHTERALQRRARPHNVIPLQTRPKRVQTTQDQNSLVLGVTFESFGFESENKGFFDIQRFS